MMRGHIQENDDLQNLNLEEWGPASPRWLIGLRSLWHKVRDEVVIAADSHHNGRCENEESTKKEMSFATIVGAMKISKDKESE
jgi:hypothetical protein